MGTPSLQTTFADDPQESRSTQPWPTRQTRPPRRRSGTAPTGSTSPSSSPSSAASIVGLLAPDVGKSVGVLGTMFVSLIKMMIVPVIFCTIVLGIGKVRAAATVGKVGGLAFVYFLVMSTVALAIGLVVGNLLSPGTGLNLVGDVGAKGGQLAEQAQEAGGLSEFVQHIIPTSFFSSLTEGNVLQALFVALLVGFAVQTLGGSREPILRGIEHLQKLVFKVLAMILWLAPIGAFGAIANVVGQTGWSAVTQLLTLMLGFYLTCIVFVFGVLGVLLRVVSGVSIFRLVRYLAREYLLIFATSSSESALPRLIAKMEHLGVEKTTVGVVVPTGYSFNLDGTAIYLTMASLFVADAMGKPLADRRADLAAGVHDRRVQGRGGCQRCRAGDAGRRPSGAPSRPARRRRADRRHRPVHVRGAGGDQLLRQCRRDGAGRFVDQDRRQGPGRRGAERSQAVRRVDDGRRPRFRRRRACAGANPCAGVGRTMMGTRPVPRWPGPFMSD